MTLTRVLTLLAVEYASILLSLDIYKVNQIIKFCNIYLFADDTKLFCLGKSIKQPNNLFSIDLKHLVIWLNTDYKLIK